VVLPLIDLPLELSVDELLLLEPSWNIYGTGAEHEALSLRGLWRRTQLLELSVDELLLLEPSWNIYGTGAEHEALSLRGLWRRTQLHIDRLETSAKDLGSLSFGGDIEFSGGWPLQVDGELVATGSIPWEGLGNEPVLGKDWATSPSPSLLPVAWTPWLPGSIPGAFRLSQWWPSTTAIPGPARSLGARRPGAGGTGRRTGAAGGTGAGTALECHAGGLYFTAELRTSRSVDRPGIPGRAARCRRRPRRRAAVPP
jgi:hypothetical protein